MKQFLLNLWEEHISYWFLNMSFKFTMWRVTNPITRWIWKRRIKRLNKATARAEESLKRLIAEGWIELDETGLA